MSISAIFSFIKSDKLQLTMSGCLRLKMLKLNAKLKQLSNFVAVLSLSVNFAQVEKSHKSEKVILLDNLDQVQAESSTQERDKSDIK